MKTYIVGGAVRDELLSLPIKERDWLVTDATPEMMLAKGFRPVGNDFPVFLHPETKEEYALARTEKKNGHGYGGFTFYTAPDITVEQDLYRRDLTINAIAKRPDGTLIDPYNGVHDLNNRLLRHVSPAFTEDPLRVLRVAKFATRFAKQGFTVAPETLMLMREISESGELSFLKGERIWQETLDALSCPQPDLYFETLERCGALDILFPSILENYRTDHRELCPSRVAMNKAAQQDMDCRIRFVCGLTPWKTTVENSLKACQQVSKTLRVLKVPKGYQDILIIIVKHLSALFVLDVQSPKALLNILETIDAFRRKDRFFMILSVYQLLMDAAKLQNGQAELLKKSFLCSQDVDVQVLIGQGYKGKNLAEKIRETRLKKIEGMLNETMPNN